MELSFVSEMQRSSDRPLILVAEDNEDNLLLLLHILDMLGLSYVSTQNGQSVLGLAKRYQPDLILLDVVLPDINGLDVIALLKQDSSTAAIPIVAVTALAKDDDRDHLLRIGCNGYLHKPYDLVELEATIYRQLCRYQIPSAS